eukprot:4016622-Prymnesium_polylepis.1
MITQFPPRSNGIFGCCHTRVRDDLAVQCVVNRLALLGGRVVGTALETLGVLWLQVRGDRHGRRAPVHEERASHGQPQQ